MDGEHQRAPLGDNEFGQCNPPPGLSNVVAVAGGAAFSFALVGSTNRPVILEHPRGGVVAIGEARAISPAPLSYQWRRDGAPIPGATGALPLRYQWAFEREAIRGATDAVLTLTGVSLAQAGRYRVLVTNPDGAVTSDEVRLELAGPRLEWTLTEGQLVLSWPIGNTLQSATNVVGPYLDVVPAANPCVIIPGPEVQRSYRVRQ